MKKFFENPVGRGYSSPAIEVIDLHYEGVICMSGNGTIDPGEEDDWGTLALLGF